MEESSSSSLGVATGALVGLIFLWIFSALSCCIGTYCLIRCMMTTGAPRRQRMTQHTTQKTSNTTNTTPQLITATTTQAVPMNGTNTMQQQMDPNQNSYMMTSTFQQGTGNQLIYNPNATNGGVYPQYQQNGQPVNGADQSVNTSVNLGNQSFMGLLSGTPETKQNLIMNSGSMLFPHRKEYEHTDLEDDQPPMSSNRMSRLKHIPRDETTKNYLETSQNISKKAKEKEKPFSLTNI